MTIVQMNSMRKTIVAVVGLVVLILISLRTIPVHAHQPFDVGPYHIEIGWATEPPVTWQQNAVEVIVTNSTDQSEVIGLASNLTITLHYAGQNKVFSGAAGRILTTDTNGVYHAPVILTEPGSYNATLTGTIKSTAVNLIAVPDGFERVEDGFDSSNPNGILFPGPAQSPSQLQASTGDANNRANTAMLLGYLGVAVGVLGILVAVISLLRGRRTVIPK